LGFFTEPVTALAAMAESKDYLRERELQRIFARHGFLLKFCGGNLIFRTNCCGNGIS
jgi:hypothetical protein